MEATIPSLCASTASCAAAAIGYAFAQPHLYERQPHNTTPNRPALFPTSTPRHSLSTASSTPIPSRTVRRKRSATSPLRANPDSRLAGLEEGSETRASPEKKEGLSRQQSGVGLEGLDVDAKRTSWIRRLSTIAPSTDGSFGSPSFNRPSTPSVFSNGSSAPFFSSPPPAVTTRNKLVKRSTSQKVLHSGYQFSPPFSTRAPTFRRPATSYQRSENLRLQNLQQNIAPADTPPHGSREPLNVPEGLIVSVPEPARKRRPFFHYQHLRIARETPARRGSGPKIFGGFDQISCVVLGTDQHPILVMASSVDKPRKEMTQLADSTPQGMNEPTLEQDHDPNEGNRAYREGRSRNSFSFGDKLSSSPSSWRLGRGGSLKRKKGRENMSVGRRIVSAPQRKSYDAVDGQTVKQSAETGSNAWRRSQPRVPSSPLPPLDKVSAFEIDLPGTSSSNRTDSMLEESHGFSNLDSPLTNASATHAGQAGVRARTSSNRASRVPSDYSTAFGSDNEHSRVFSIDGDDIDRRSETVYDSIRTDASGSSHSGVRNYKIETVFTDHATPDMIKQNISTLQDRLSGLSLLGQKRHEDFIAEEEESMQTPVWRQSSPQDETLTPATPGKANGPPHLYFASSPLPVEQFHHTSLNSNSLIKPKDQDNSSNLLNDLDDEGFWDDELEMDTSQQVIGAMVPPSPLHSSILLDSSEHPRSNIFEWSERQPVDMASQTETTQRPSSSNPQQLAERGGRPAGRRLTGGLHSRSQSVPLKPENSKHRFNTSAKLDNWKLGNKGVSEEWDNDFDFAEDSNNPSEAAEEGLESARGKQHLSIPSHIEDRQASVHGQFGHVKELALLVEELRKLHRLAATYDILEGQSSVLWKEAEGIIDLATLDEEEQSQTLPPKPTKSAVSDLDMFEEDEPLASSNHSGGPGIEISRHIAHAQGDLTSAIQPATLSSPAESHQGNPKGRPREDSVARAKNVLENIHQHRSPQDPPLEPVEEHLASSKSKKMAFDTTSLRDLVTRAGVVTRACKEIIRKIEDPGYNPQTPERRSASPPSDPPFSQIFEKSPKPSTPGVDQQSSGHIQERRNQ